MPRMPSAQGPSAAVRKWLIGAVNENSVPNTTPTRTMKTMSSVVNWLLSADALVAMRPSDARHPGAISCSPQYPVPRYSWDPTPSLSSGLDCREPDRLLGPRQRVGNRWDADRTGEQQDCLAHLVGRGPRGERHGGVPLHALLVARRCYH